MWSRVGVSRWVAVVEDCAGSEFSSGAAMEAPFWAGSATRIRSPEAETDVGWSVCETSLVGVTLHPSLRDPGDPLCRGLRGRGHHGSMRESVYPS